MSLNSYETVFIITPVLSEAQTKDTVDKFKDLLKNNKAEIVHEENWGLKALSYEIKAKSTGFYILIEFKSEPSFVATLETEFKRDERILRFLTVSLDKHAIAYSEKRRKGFPKTKKEVAA
jgi:small subunit ribosomal protein S6